MKLFVFLSFLFLFNNVFGQQFYNIKLPGRNNGKKCEKCLGIIKNMPKEIQYSIQRADNDNLYFVVSRKDWFDLLLKKSGDGIAVDIICKDRYNCSNVKLDKKQYIRGDLQPPVYLKDLKQNMLVSQNGEVVIKIGTVPDKYKNREVEFNILFTEVSHDPLSRI